MFVLQNYGQQVSIYDTQQNRSKKNPRPIQDGDFSYLNIY